MGKPVNKTLRIAAMSAGEEIGHVSGPIVTFRGNGDPLRSLVANIEPVQSGSGDPSPDNVRPISGWSAVNVWRTGKNLLNSSIVHGIWTVERWYSHEGYNTTYLSTRYAVPVVGGKTYCFSLKNDSSNPAAFSSFIAFANGNAISEASWFNIADGIINVPSGADSIVINIGLTNNIESISDVSATDFQLELGSTATAYEPYSGNQYTIQLGQTVYGGTLDVANGVLTVDRAYWTKNTSTMNNASAYPGWRGSGLKALGYSGSAVIRDVVMNVGTSFSYNENKDILFLSTSIYGKTQEEWTALAIDVQIVVPLATPITIQLTPTEISTLKGQNNLWADSGDVDVEYIATGGEGGKLALLLRNRKELLIALRKGLTPAEAGLLNSTPLLGGFVRPGLSTDDEKEEDELI